MSGMNGTDNSNMGPFQVTARVLAVEPLAPRYFLLTLDAPEIAAATRPGQFVHVRCGSTYDPLLRRPFSVHDIDPAAGTISLLVRVVGPGTAYLERRRPGESLDIIGPLGNGFPELPGGNEPFCLPSVLLVAGGIGVAPLYALARRELAARRKVRLLFGARSAAGLVRLDAFRALGVTVEVATEDGSAGHRGTVGDLLAREMVMMGAGAGVAYACGPLAMLRAVKEQVRAAGIEAYVSLDERMACGVGACLGCTCRVKAGDTERYARVCADGPVFAAGEVILDG